MLGPLLPSLAPKHRCHDASDNSAAACGQRFSTPAAADMAGVQADGRRSACRPRHLAREIAQMDLKNRCQTGPDLINSGQSQNEQGLAGRSVTGRQVVPSGFANQCVRPCWPWEGGLLLVGILGLRAT